MAYEIIAEEVWVGAVDDRPGGLADKLEAISKAGENLEFMLSMRNLEMPGTGVLVIAPVHDFEAIKSAERGGMSKWTTIHALRIAGDDQPGLGGLITRAVGGAGVNMRGASGSKSGNRVVFHLAFDSAIDADKARIALAKILGA